jgi:hypothetical protein
VTNLNVIEDGLVNPQPNPSGDPVSLVTIKTNIIQLPMVERISSCKKKGKASFECRRCLFDFRCCIACSMDIG